MRWVGECFCVVDAEAGVQQRRVHVSMAGDTMLVDAAVAVGVCVRLSV